MGNFQSKSYKAIITACKASQRAIKIKEKLDEYDYGMYNGIEYVRSLLDQKEPEYIYPIPDNIEIKEVTGSELKEFTGRTIARGVKR